jgi:hypothetical protein
LAIWLATLALVVEFTVSANLLTAAGSLYVSDGGWLAEKLHPGSYLAAGAMAARLASGGHPVRATWSLAWREPDLALFLAAIAFCVLYAAAMTGPGNLITLLDSFLPAGMIGAALAGMTNVESARLQNVLRALLLLNACVALGEAAMGAHLVPIDPVIPERAADFRPTSLYDHPLTGAAATMLGMFLLPDPARRPLAACAYGTCMFAALLVFGGRAALLLTVLFMAGWYACCVGQKVAQRCVTPAQLTPVLTAAAAGGAALCGVLATGLGERLVAHLYWDPSARARLDQLQILKLLNTPQLVFGCRRADLVAMIEPLRLQSGVDVLENFWLLMFVSLGALCFPVFMVGMLALVRSLWRRSDAPGRMMIAALLVAASASNSLGRKSTLLVLLVACVMASGTRVSRSHRGVLAVEFRSALPSV